ncbi:hypothetical protein J132_04744 [Termitomyces sp. J132]|nr:hypothetical protein C0989_009662 [Termitomyces sp. Mn162]KAH0580664.1 hypothetical protein H2248_002154 [Termitomyces sp. 'cryptogamus']KNZ79044.1 hypothetical protein J132_04744 [Termitomyces sp. J132]
MDSSDKILSYKLTTIAAGVNYNILLDSEIQRARTLLSDAEHILDKLNEGLEALVARRDAQAELICKYRIALAPHKRLAPELLSEIFLHCLSTTSSYSSIPPKTTDAPWMLGQVCAQWRAVSRADPRLWRPTKMSIYDRPHRHLAHACELLPPAARLSVAFIGPPALVTVALVPYLWRIHDLTLRMGIAGYDAFFQNISPNDFITLESADFDVIDGAFEDITLRWERSAGVFNLANKFRQLRIETAGGFPISKLGIPLSKITSLNISGVKDLHTQAAISILRDCHWLETLDVSFSSHDSDLAESTLYLPRLQSLRVRNHLPSPLQHSSVWDNLSSLNLLSVINIDSCTLYTVLKRSVNLIELHSRCPEGGTITSLPRNLRLPSLRKLSLTNVVDTWLFDSLIVPSLRELLIQSTQVPLNPPAIRNLLVYSGTKLSIFWFQSTHPQQTTSPHGLRELLDAIPSALHVEDTHSLLDESLLKEIGSGILLPRLEFLRCWPETQEAFLDMAEARARQLSGTVRPPRTLKQAFGVSQIGVRLPKLTLASRLRLGKLRLRGRLVCSLYPSSSTWDEYPD